MEPDRAGRRLGSKSRPARSAEIDQQKDLDLGGRMVQTKVKQSGKTGSRGRPRRSGSTTSRSRKTSARRNGATSSRARRASKNSAPRASRATKNSGPSGSRRKSGGPITGLTRYLAGTVRNKSMNGRGRAVASKAKGVVVGAGKGLGAVGGAASRAKGVAAVGAAGLAGLAGGIALDRWNNSYSRTQAFARTRRGRR
jgi:hypothetical protein